MDGVGGTPRWWVESGEVRVKLAQVGGEVGVDGQLPAYVGQPVRQLVEVSVDVAKLNCPPQSLARLPNKICEIYKLPGWFVTPGAKPYYQLGVSQYHDALVALILPLYYYLQRFLQRSELRLVVGRALVPKP